MFNNVLINIILCVLPATAVFVELFLKFPVAKSVRIILSDAAQGTALIKSQNISDHWKEKALPQYSKRIMASCLTLAFYLLILFLGFIAVYVISGLLFIGDLETVIKTFSQLEMHIGAIVSGALYILLKNKVFRQASESDNDYTLSSKVLHHIVMGSSIVKEMAFDIDCLLTKTQKAQPKVISPVYIAGLARAGTTILLEALNASGAFTTLTYRDMPLITAPFLWDKITKLSMIKDDTKKERAHGDELLVNYDSPEAFEEVFWLTFSNASYIKENHLQLQDADQELIDRYTSYVRNVIATRCNGRPLRYLAKNNNNLMRIDTIKTAFADAVIIVPFRNPINHAKSLHLQHQRFLKRHAEDPFSLKYMNWLGHYDFGANFKPIKFDPNTLISDEAEPTMIEYWLRYWGSAYKYILKNHSSQVIFFNYDKFCELPASCLARLESELSMEENVLQRFSDSVRPAKQYLPPAQEQLLLSQVKYVHDELVRISI